MILPVLGYISALLAVVCYIPYIRDILNRTTKPERATWLIWMVLGGIAFFSQLAKGATHSLWMTAVQTIGVVVIFMLSLKFGSGGLMTRDKIALGAAGLGLAVWYFTNEAVLALVMVILIDAAGGLPTLVKAYQDPGSETMSTWVLGSLSGVFAALAVGSLDYVLLAYPIYIAVMNSAVAGAMIMGRKRLRAAG